MDCMGGAIRSVRCRDALNGFSRSLAAAAICWRLHMRAFGSVAACLRCLRCKIARNRWSY
jgi:hypothetical protein